MENISDKILKIRSEYGDKALVKEDLNPDPIKLFESWLENAKNEEELSWVKHYKKRPFEEFYDLKIDPYEKNNLAQNPKFFDIKENLKTQLKSWMSQQGDLGVDTEMIAVTRQQRSGKWLSYEAKIKSKGRKQIN